jgi:hypothetical protein
MEYTGKVTCKPFAAGSKSAHEAVWLVTDSAEYKLEREEGNPFHDPVLEGLIGKRISCKGKVLGTILRISEWTETQ